MAEEFASLGIFEVSGVVFALISVVLAIKENRFCWIAAIISSLAYIPTFYLAKLYTEVLLQIFFISISWIGWQNWKIEGLEKLVKINILSYRKHLEICFFCFFITLVLGTFLKLYSNASFPYADSAITVFSVMTSVLQAKKILESWIYWILIDAGAIFVYINKSLLLTAGLYALYLVLAFLGYIEWLKIFKAENESSNILKRGTDTGGLVS